MSPKETREQTIPMLLASVGTVASGDTRKPSAKSRRRTKEAKPQMTYSGYLLEGRTNPG